MQRLSNFINGEFVPPISGKYIDNVNPSTQSINNLIPDSDQRDIEQAVKAAQNAYKTWGKLHFSERAVYLDKIAAVMREDHIFEELTIADSKDMGKPIKFMKESDVPGSIKKFLGFSRLIQSITTPYYQMVDAVGIEHRNPIGLVGLITPWNFPLFLFCMKLSAAIVCGNCVICKPSEISPTTSYLMCAIFAKAGLPPGVVNVVHGYGMKAGEAISQHNAIRAISFTGGSVTGSRISSIAAPKLKKLQLELGGKNPAIVFNDCYLDETVEGIAKCEFFNTGQVCCSGSRLLIQSGIADTFIDKLIQHLNTVYIPNIGDPLDETTMMGPLSSRGHFDKVKRYLDLAKKEGGTILCGGKYGRSVAVARGMRSELMDGNWIEPTVVTGLKHNARCALEEIFGPILTVLTFDTEEEAIKLANEVEYGLASSVWTSDIRRGQRVAREIEAGFVWINCYLYRDARMAFGGFKNSGVQRDGGIHSIDFFTERKSIVSKL